MKGHFKKHQPLQLIEENPETGLHEFKVKYSKPLPDKLAAIAIEATEHLRSCLDHCGYAIAKAAGRANPDCAHFPFGPDDRYVNGRGKSKHLPDPIFALMRSFKPYKGGNTLLWALNDTVGTSKHELLSPMCVAVAGVQIAHARHTGGRFEIPIPRWDREKNEIVLARMGAETTHFDYKGNFAAAVCFEHAEALRQRPAVDVLWGMVGLVENIVTAVDAKARSLGWVV